MSCQLVLTHNVLFAPSTTTRHIHFVCTHCGYVSRCQKKGIKKALTSMPRAVLDGHSIFAVLIFAVHVTVNVWWLTCGASFVSHQATEVLSPAIELCFCSICWKYAMFLLPPNASCFCTNPGQSAQQGLSSTLAAQYMCSMYFHIWTRGCVKPRW